MKLYYKYLRKCHLPFLTAVICVSLEALCDLLGPTLMSQIINSGIGNSDMDQVLHWGLLMLLVTGLGAVFAVTRNILASNVSQRIGADLRLDLFDKILHFSEAGADRIESGSLITRLTNDTNQVVQFINGIMRIFLKAPLTCIGSIILATILNWRLSFLVYGVVFVVGSLIVISMKLSYPRFSRLQEAMDRINRSVQEYLIGVRLVKAFGTYPEEEVKFSEANDHLMTQGISSQIIITCISPLLSLTVGFGTAAAIYIGARLFTVNLADPGQISAFIIYLAQLLGSLLMITSVFNTFVRTKASTQRIREVFDCENDVPDSPAAVLPAVKGEITFEHVTFAYPGGSGIPVLSDLSFHMSCGESLAVIGPTGSGKSTIAWLLLRFYDVQEGRILLDGIDLRSLGVDTIRHAVSIVPQKPSLFSGSVSNNIRWGDPHADEDRIREAAGKAQAGFIDRMPQGYDSPISSGAVNLSGGQKQRLSIARGLIRHSPILILDDATSALDAVTEAKVRTALLKEKRGIILITQRCTTAMAADRILVLENGRMMGFGSHAKLLESCGVYRDIYSSQIESKEA